MKFLAMLKDSVREAIDYKVFYVMVALSVLLTLLALSVSFAPVPGGDRVVRDFAILGLNNDIGSLDQAQALNVLFRARPIQFDLDSVTPLEGEEDAPTSRFKVRVTAKFATAAAAKQAQADTKQTEAFIQEHFGLVEGRHMMEAEDVRFVEWKGFDLPLVNTRKGVFDLTARPTPVTIRFWPHRLWLLFGLVPIGGQAVSFPLFQQILLIENVLVGFIGSTIAVLISIVITAFFIPNMLRKGSIDLLLVKPISRPTLLLYKFVGGLTFIFLNTAVAVAGIWLALGLRSGVWAVTFLFTIFELTFFFAILYSVSALFGVLTRSPIASILLTCFAWFLLFIVGVLHNVFETFRAMDRTAQVLEEKLGPDALKNLQGEAIDPANKEPEPGRPRGQVRIEDLRFHENWFTRGMVYVHAILPRTSDLQNLMARRLQHDVALGEFTTPPVEDKPPPELPGGIPLPQIEVKQPSPMETLGVSTAFIAIMLGIACWWFATKDY
jgi:ABC-type transport system involved in multi-copper enzyme maturation permease subunit